MSGEVIVLWRNNFLFLERSRRRAVQALAVCVFLELASLAAFGDGVSNPVPLVNQPLVPAVAVPGGAAFTLTVNGTGFASAATVNWNGSPRATTFVSSSQLSAAINATDIAVAGTASVTVVNPTPGGGTSNVAYFLITAPTTSIGTGRTDIAVEELPVWVVAGDFNGDGIPDLAVVNYCGSSSSCEDAPIGSVSILLGNGDGTFTLKTTLTTSYFPQGAAVGDFNGDGKLDLAVVDQCSEITCRQAGVVSVFLGIGDGTFTAASLPDTGFSPYGIAVGDFNGDGKLDMAVVNQCGNTGDCAAGSISVLVGNGDGTFTLAASPAVGRYASRLAVGDFNRDGLLDIAVPNPEDGSVSVLLGYGDGTFAQAPQSPFSIGECPLAIAAGDLNADGILDLAITDQCQNVVFVLAGHGDGTFNTDVSGIQVGSSPSDVAIGDLNGDNIPDLAVANAYDSTVSILLGTGGGAFTKVATPTTGYSPAALALADFNRDGRLDIAVADDTYDGMVTILLQGPAVTLSSTPLTFPAQTMYTTSAVMSAILANTGSAPSPSLSISSITISGTNSNDFALATTGTSCPYNGGTVALNQTCTIDVTFTPSVLPPGSETAAVTITDNAGDSPQSFTLTGTGTSPSPLASLSPSSLNFPNESIGVPSSSQSVTLTNFGNTALTLSSISIAGLNSGDFTLTTTGSSCPYTGGLLNPAATCTIDVIFTPSAAGSRLAVVNVNDNSVTGPQQTISLTGTGLGVGSTPVPLINQPLVPISVAPGGTGFTLTVNGTGFLSGATVNWNSSPRTTTFVSNKQLTATINAADIAAAGTSAVTVSNPTSGTSNVVYFPIANAASPVFFGNAPNSPIGVGYYPVSVAVGDFNGDGKPDLAVANYGSYYVTILLGNGDGTFTAGAYLYTGSNPYSVAVGDFNGDGKLDLAVANLGSDTVTILLGNGDGTFTSGAQSPATGYSPYSVAVGDFNGDGNLDLAVANEGSNNLTILLGNGDGTFTPTAQSPATGTYPWSVAVGDFNGDGKLDLAVANEGSDTVTILLGKGDGEFTPAASPATGSGPVSVSVGDFNGDGKLDLAVANYYSSTVTILLGNGDGTFTPAASPATGANPNSVALGDFNGDGKLDLAIANSNYGTDTLTILLGNGDGTFSASAQSPATGYSPYSVAVGDFNGDGRLDLAVANESSDSVSVLLQAPVAMVSPTSLSFGNQILGTTSGVLSSTVTNSGGESIPLNISSVSISGANATSFTLATTGTSCPYGGGTLAYGASCTIDVTYTPSFPPASETASVSIASNAGSSPAIVTLTGTGVFAPGTAWAVVSPTSLAFANQSPGASGPENAANLSNIGNASLVGSISITGANAGDFSVAADSTCPASGFSLAAGGNCLVNIVFTPSALGPRSATVNITDNSSGGSPQAISLTGAGANPVPFVSQAFSPASAAPGGSAFTLTVNGANFVAGSVVNWNGSPRSTTFVSGNRLTASITAADIAAPGTAVVTVVNPSVSPEVGVSNPVAFQVTTPTASFLFTRADLSTDNEPQAVVFGDFNNDGKLDAVVVNSCGSDLTCLSPGTVSVLLGDGAGGFALQSSPSVDYGPVAAAVGDFNGDGNLDLAVVNSCGSDFYCYGYSAGTVSILLGNGDGTFAPETEFDVGSQPESIAVGDFNGDGILDLAVANFSDGTITLLVGNGDGTFSRFGNGGGSPIGASAGAPGSTSTRKDYAEGKEGTLRVEGAGRTTEVAKGKTIAMMPTAAGAPLGAGAATHPWSQEEYANIMKFTAPGVGSGFSTADHPKAKNELPEAATAAASQADADAKLLASGYGDLCCINQPTSLVAGDFNGDGILDLAVASYTDNGVYILQGQGNGQFTVGSLISTGNGPSSLVAGDFNGDGVPDLAVANMVDNSVTVLLNSQGNFALSSTPATGLSPRSVATGDINGDGKLDLVVANEGDNTVSVMLGNGDGTFQARNDTPTAHVPTWAAIGDLNGDGRLDVGVPNFQDNTVSFFLQATLATLSTTALDFGTELVGSTSAAQTVTVTNTGTAPLTTSSVTITGTNAADFAKTADTCTGASVAPGDTCSVSVSFTPAATGSRTATLTFTDNATGSPQSVSLTGIGIAPVVSLGQTSLTFANQLVGTTSAAQTVTLSNTGTADLTITSIVASGDFAQTNNCGSTVTAGGNCTISVTFTPTATGARTGAVTITDNASDSPQTISLSGTGVAPAVSLLPASLTFANQIVGTASAAQTVTLTNSGAATLTITSIVASGDFAQTNTCGTSVAAGGNCTISVTFTPTATGTRTGTVTITDNASNTPQTISLSGTGVTPVVSLLPTSLTFANQIVGTTSAAQTVTLTNTGSAALAISSITVTGANPGDFAVALPGTPGPIACQLLIGSTLGAGASCRIPVTFTPTATGTRTGAVTITDDASGSPQSITLTGTGISGAAVTLSTNSLQLPDTHVNQTCQPGTVTLTSTGSAPVTISSITVSGQFTETNTCPASLAPGNSCAVTVTFAPTTTGAQTGTLTITSNAANSPNTVALSGNGLAPCFLGSNSPSSSVPRGVDTTTFTVAHQACSAVGTVQLSCTNQNPATCTFSPATVTAGQPSTLTLSNLKAVTGGGLSFQVHGDAALEHLLTNLSVKFLDFILTSAPSSQSISAGQSATFALALAPQNGLRGSISLACTGAPQGATCNVSPPSVTFTDTNPANLTVTVTTTARSLVPPRGPWRVPGGTPSGPLGLVILALLASALAYVKARPWRPVRLRLAMMAAGLMVAMVATWAACGGGMAPQSSVSNATPAGSYNLIVTATYNVAGTDLQIVHNSTLQLTVH